MPPTKLEGVVPNLPDAEYHQHPALSSTGVRLLLDSPAKFQYRQLHPEPHRKVFDVGAAVHAEVLGIGAGTEMIPDALLASNGAASTAAAKEFIADVRMRGNIPVKRAEADEISAVTSSVLAHPEARRLFEQAGTPEASVFATDPDTGTDMRARFDYLPDFTVSEPVAVDLKTARDASPEGFARAVAEHRYDIQEEWYELTYALATGDFVLPMKFVAVEKEPPYLVGVYSLSREFKDMARLKVQEALHLYANCTTTNKWPGYPLNPDPLQPPTWLMFSEGMIE